MAKIYERLLSTNILREKRRDSFDPQRENPLGEDSICMVNLLGTPQVIVYFYYMIDLVWLFHKRSFVLSTYFTLYVFLLYLYSFIVKSIESFFWNGLYKNKLIIIIIIIKGA